jgi:Ca-activated chloride channel family protein
MRLLLLLSVSLLWLAWPTARAQSADDFFNGGAHSYISNNIPQALATVESGLERYPDDVKLKKLYELLKQQQQSQQQSQNNQSQQNQNQQSRPNQPQQQKSNNQQNQQPSQPNSQPQNQNQPNPSGQNNDEQQKQPQPTPGGKPGDEKPENQNGQGQPATAGQMTPEDAGRLLDAQKGDEQFLQLNPRGKPQNQPPPGKDW